jgi:hypothetical protein
MSVHQRGIADDERPGFRKDDRATERHLRRQNPTIHIGYFGVSEMLDVHEGTLLCGYFRHCNLVVIFAIIVVETYARLARLIRRVFDDEKRLAVIRQIKGNG